MMLMLSELDLVIFCTNLSGLDSGDTLDQQNFTTTEKIQLARLPQTSFIEVIMNILWISSYDGITYRFEGCLAP